VSVGLRRSHRDLAAELPFTEDTLVRMFSMTKPITSVAAMMLYEEGAFELKDPVSRLPGVP
jgi:CubicO group peptidase (beta-lactamase class C family)